MHGELEPSWAVLVVRGAWSRSLFWVNFVGRHIMDKRASSCRSSTFIPNLTTVHVCQKDCLHPDLWFTPKLTWCLVECEFCSLQKASLWTHHSVFVFFSLITLERKRCSTEDLHCHDRPRTGILIDTPLPERQHAVAASKCGKIGGREENS